jgi:hypothetical protein
MRHFLMIWHSIWHPSLLPLPFIPPPHPPTPTPHTTHPCLLQVLADLGKTSNDFKQLTAKSLDQLCTALMPRFRGLLDDITSISYELSEAEYSAGKGVHAVGLFVVCVWY